MISGASRGIGFAIAQRLLNDGHNISLGVRDPDRLRQDHPDLVDAGLDLFNRPQRMTPRTFEAWCAMRTAAKSDDLELNLVSAHRSIEYQCGLIRRKLEGGESIGEILLVNAIPGYSEHHTGRALDLHALGYELP